jgi:transcription elongation factor Elf1
MIEDTYQHEPFECPGCGMLMDASTNMTKNHGKPESGDLSVCLYCGTMLEFGDGKPHELSMEVYASLGSEMQFKLQRVRQEIMAMKVKPPR